MTLSAFDSSSDVVDQSYEGTKYGRSFFSWVTGTVPLSVPFLSHQTGTAALAVPLLQSKAVLVKRAVRKRRSLFKGTVKDWS